MVSKRPAAWATSALVPTPSVDDTSTGLAVAGGVEAEQAAEPADVADDLGPEGRADLGLDALDRLLAGGDADAGRLVGLAHQAVRSPLRVPASAVGRQSASSSDSSGHAVAAARGSPTRLRRPRARPWCRLDRHLDRVVAGEAGVAEAGADRAGGRRCSRSSAR